MSKRAEQARHYLLHEHRSPLNDIMHQADLNAEKQYCNDIENAYLAGYQQAEKDLALTWRDIKDIDEWISAIQTSDGLFGRDLYEEVLKRFNESKKQ